MYGRRGNGKKDIEKKDSLKLSNESQTKERMGRIRLKDYE